MEAASNPSMAAGPKEKTDSLFKEGDMVLVSSDNVVFRLPSFYLLAQSVVIRDMYHAGASTATEIRLCDSAIECAFAIRLWLQMVTDQLPADLEPGMVAQAVMPLARKYDCSQIAFTLTSLLHLSYDGPGHTKLSTVVATMMYGTPALIAKAIRRELKFPDTESTDVGNIPGASSVNPSGWGLDMYKKVPHDHLWALSRTQELGGTTQERATRFLSLMSQISPPNPKKRKADEVDVSQA